ncbi:Oidioi.mRNA.OKI2018_I69.chr2.g7975.t1.cds [Oikopleura dioica]|uniref:Oidioi.mRNA.OKI2018_I69.chr2.g7975.t1.cds n=1 Tax=Oikopleura dioica TaxID=34765 RepID=A0ABN7TE96_OIKDI|nr:Oidioi.mRNA.OKI2018_I69.chr2.g7975.t1.cds [Oikopleura dioica]
MKPLINIFSKKKVKLQGQVYECPEMDETFFFDLKATPHVFKGENRNDFMSFKFDPNIRMFTGIVRWQLPHNDRIAESWFQFKFTEDYQSVENVQRKNYDTAKQQVDAVWKNKNLMYEYIQPKTNKNEKWRTFDISLEECPTISGIPRVLYICCSAIERRPEKSLGVYRAPGNRQLQERLIKVLNNKRHKTQSIKEHVNACDSQTLASLVIDFIRRLPQPVLSDEFLEDCREIVAMEDDIEQIRNFRNRLLPSFLIRKTSYFYSIRD